MKEKPMSVSTHHTRDENGGAVVRNLLISIIGTLLLGITAVIPALADAPASERALEWMQIAFSNIEIVVAKGTEGQAADVTKHANVAKRAAENAIQVMPISDPHGREAAKLLREAIAYLDCAALEGQNDHLKPAINKAKIALDFADAAVMHVQHAH